MAKKVAFLKVGPEEEITKAVAPEGYEPFDVTFTVPNKVTAAVDMLLESTNEGRGMAAAKYIARHLKAWSLPQPATLESVLALDDADVLFAIFGAIHGAQQQAKN